MKKKSQLQGKPGQRLKYDAHNITYQAIYDGYQPIEDYGVIGDLKTAALVGRDGSIDFMCFPRFDSPSIFCAVLDHKVGGRFQITPVLGEARQKKLYVPDTNCLISRFLSDDGVAEVSDFMNLKEKDSEQALIRRAKTVRGEISFRMIFQPRFDYARAGHNIEIVNDKEVIFISQAEVKLAIRLLSEVAVKIEDGAAIAEFKLSAGQTAAFILEEAIPGKESPAKSADYVSASFKNTQNYWRSWIGRSSYKGRWREMVKRSALTLKMLTSREFGSIVAAPTFGLPTEIGSERNWDYRYTWIRDASFTIYALLRLGFTDEAAQFIRWFENRLLELDHASKLQLMYGLDGTKKLTEIQLVHLEGYRKTKPIRIGNDAYTQFQLDIYGELLDSIYLYDKFGQPVSHDLWMRITELVDWLCDNWCQADVGIWEIRAQPRKFLHSWLMCWVAIDRGIRMAVRRSRPALLQKWHQARDDIYRAIHRDFWQPGLNSFTQYMGSTNVDGAMLLMPLMRFIAPADPRWLGTLQKIENDLVEDSLVYRYRSNEEFSDGLTGGEGTFSICSFWYIECVSRSGDLRKARFLFEKMLGYASDLGLYPEQLGRRAEFLGNIPQAFTHLSLISTAYDLNRRLEDGESMGFRYWDEK